MNTPFNEIKMKFKTNIRIVFTLIFTVLFSVSLFSQEIIHSDYATGFSKPTGFVCDSHGNFLVWEQGGKVWFVSKNGVKSTLPILNISPEVFDFSQLGLNSIILDPDYENNGYVYAHYNVDLYWELLANKNSFNPTTGDQPFNGWPTCSFVRVTRFKFENIHTIPTLANINPREVLLSQNRFNAPVTTAFSHSGGGMAFGHDGSLLICIGDGAVANDNQNGDVGSNYWSDFDGAIDLGIMTSQDNIGTLRVLNKSNYSGKVLRINPSTGQGYSSNPYYNPSNPNSALSKFWAYGLRNPFRMTYIDDHSGSHNPNDGRPGKFLISEVGSYLFEEMNILSNSNQFFGWPKFEGISHLNTWGNLPTRVINDTIISPLIEYRNTVGRSVNLDGSIFNIPGLNSVSGSSILGGFIYTKNDFPSIYRNNIFFADYDSRNIYALKVNANLIPQNISFFAQSEDKLGYIDTNPELDGIFYISGCGEPSGKLKRLKMEDNTILTAKMAISHTSGFSPNLVNFHAENTKYAGSKTLNYHWDFGDGNTSNLKNVSHVFNDSTIKDIKIKLVIQDEDLVTSSDSVIFKINTVAPELLSTSLDSFESISENVDTTINLSYTSSYSIPNSNVEWRLVICHNGHEHPRDIKIGNNASLTIPRAICKSGGATYWYRIYLTLTNNLEQKTEWHKDIYLNCTTGNSQNIVFNEIPDQNFGISNLVLNATSSSGLNIEYFILKGNANINGNIIEFLPNSSGEIIVRAIQSGGSGFEPARPVDRTFKILKNKCVENFSIVKLNEKISFEGFNNAILKSKLVKFPNSTSSINFSQRFFELLPGFDVNPVNWSFQLKPESCF